MNSQPDVWAVDALVTGEVGFIREKKRGWTPSKGMDAGEDG